MATCAPSCPWPEMMKAILPARCMSHIRSSTARAISIWRYMASTSSSDSPRSWCRDGASVCATCSISLPATYCSSSDVDRGAVHCQGGLGQRLGQGRVGMDAHGDLGGSPFHQAGERRLREKGSGAGGAVW